MDLKQCKRVIDVGLNAGKLIMVIGRGLPALSTMQRHCDSDKNVAAFLLIPPYPQCSRVKF